MNQGANTASTGSLQITASHPDQLTLAFSGRLDSNTTGELWRETMTAIDRNNPHKVTIDASGITYCDGAGIALLVAIRLKLARIIGQCTMAGLPDSVRHLLEPYDDWTPKTSPPGRPAPPSFVTAVGAATWKIWEDLYGLIGFVGELTGALVRALAHPRQVRWKDVFTMTQLVGMNALPVTALIGVLLGLVMAFQSAIPMRRFGADLYVAHLLGLSVTRELGPLITAIILAGRSGSAFAAELGTMKVREEIDALRTMGLEPVQFLVVPRLLATVFMTPILTVYTSLFALIGGAMVMRSLGFPLATYLDALQSVVAVGDWIGGWIKACVFGIVVAGIGCLRGMQTANGASAVGNSATSAVVSGMILIVVVDGVFAVIFYFLGV